MASPADRKMEPGVSSQLWMTHVAFPTLVDYVRGLGSAASRVPVRRHLATCARCASAAASFARLTAIARADVDAEPPDAVVSAAIELFDRRTAVGRLPVSHDWSSTAPPWARPLRRTRPTQRKA